MSEKKASSPNYVRVGASEFAKAEFEFPRKIKSN